MSVPVYDINGFGLIFFIHFDRTLYNSFHSFHVHFGVRIYQSWFPCWPTIYSGCLHLDLGFPQQWISWLLDHSFSCSRLEKQAISSMWKTHCHLYQFPDAFPSLNAVIDTLILYAFEMGALTTYVYGLIYIQYVSSISLNDSIGITTSLIFVRVSSNIWRNFVWNWWTVAGAEKQSHIHGIAFYNRQMWLLSLANMTLTLILIIVYANSILVRWGSFRSSSS